jgi:type I restriction enzyme, R subunit
MLLTIFTEHDFEALSKRFKETKRQNTELEVLKAAVRAQVDKLIRLNKTRMDFREKFEELIEAYNAGSRSIEQVFEELLKLTRTLSDEQQRHVRENMSEKELVLFDLLTRSSPELTTEERAEVKKVARELLTKLKQLIVLNWRQKSAASSKVKMAIQDVLDTGLPHAYSKEIYEQKCTLLFEHFYENYPDQTVSTCAATG